MNINEPLNSNYILQYISLDPRDERYSEWYNIIEIVSKYYTSDIKYIDFAYHLVRIILQDINMYIFKVENKKSLFNKIFKGHKLLVKHEPSILDFEDTFDTLYMYHNKGTDLHFDIFRLFMYQNGIPMSDLLKWKTLFLSRPFSIEVEFIKTDCSIYVQLLQSILLLRNYSAVEYNNFTKTYSYIYSDKAKDMISQLKTTCEKYNSDFNSELNIDYLLQYSVDDLEKEINKNKECIVALTK
jgi:hypothetical protein